MTTTRRTTKLTQPATEQRTVTVLRRYAIKKAWKDLRPGDVVLVVRNDRGVEYTVTLRRGRPGQHSCTCPGNVLGGCQCYHIDRMVVAQNARYQAEKAAAVAKATEQAVVAASAKKPRSVLATRKSEDEAAGSTIVVKLAEVRQAKQAAKVSRSTEQAREEAPLNGNREFSLMKQ